MDMVTLSIEGFPGTLLQETLVIQRVLPAPPFFLRNRPSFSAWRQQLVAYGSIFLGSDVGSEGLANHEFTKVVLTQGTVKTELTMRSVCVIKDINGTQIIFDLLEESKPTRKD